MSVWVKVWTWLKANWKWLLFPVGILLFLAGWLLRPKTVVVDSALHNAALAEDKAKAEADKKNAEALAVKDAAVQKIEAEHQATIKQLTDEQKSKVTELRDDPDALNQYLLDVGNQIRG